MLLGAVLFFSVPLHVLVAFGIEKYAARLAEKRQANLKRKQFPPNIRRSIVKSRRETWDLIIFSAHFVNGLASIGLSSWFVYFNIHHPGIGATVELHALVVLLKLFSYVMTNWELRFAYLYGGSEIDLAFYKSCPYPRNISFSNVAYFYVAPTLVYQPVYPRSPKRNWAAVARRLMETMGFSAMIWFLTVQYAAPVLRNSMKHYYTGDWVGLAERLLKLSSISTSIWLVGFYALFHSYLNGLAELTQFADREFYLAWWNATTIQDYWRLWNRPVYRFMNRHIYIPLRNQGWGRTPAMAVTFFVSAVLHELLVGIPTHSVIGT
jgi:diacylglycerol O-acyltransferase-1